MTEPADLVHLVSEEASLVLAATPGTRPRLLYWGARISAPAAQALIAMTTRQHAPGSADQEVELSLINELGAGGFGPAGFLAHRNGKDWGSVFVLEQLDQVSAHQVVLVCKDASTQLQFVHDVQLDPETGIAMFQSRVTNLGDDPLIVDWCASASVPVDKRCGRLIGFTGRWAQEFQLQDIGSFTGSYVRENKTGRTSHDSFPGLILATPETTEQSGLCFGYHLGWSGNHCLRVDRLNDGRSVVQMGEYFFPGELRLGAQESYQSPPLYAGYSASGLSALSRRFHHHLRARIMAPHSARKPRPIHYNTWEAVYFDHDQKTLFELAESAASVGAERFILDDGWFGGRRSDRAGLGDWFVSDEVYPEGLAPLISHVTALGMEFGLWFEPEMVSPDSDLYREHPDWVLQLDQVSQVPFRGQYALDLTRLDVSAYLFERIDALLSAHQISYIKWDMNRDVPHPGQAGYAVAHRQVHALYALIDRLRAAHPDVEIESCSSGGGRADYGILARTDRIWTSDSNDALDRQQIQRGASHFFPLRIMGTHVGPAKCHITGRRLSMALRVATAMFGHMGMELDLRAETEADLACLKAGLALHKRYRSLIHSGDFYRVETPNFVNAVGCVAPDQSEALFSWCNLTGHSETLPGRFYVPGLDPGRTYHVQIVWPQAPRSVSSPSVLERLDLSGGGTDLRGEALSKIGLQLPLLHPETALIFHFHAID